MNVKTKKLTHKKILAISIGLAASGINNNAISKEIMLEEVIVTSTRRAERVEDIPYSISAITSDNLSRQGITDFTKLARNIPGLTFIETGARDSGINSGLIIRGLNASPSGSTDAGSLSVPTVSTYLGETPVFANVHLKDIERVEVLRGPQGTLYGSGSLGGTVRYIPKKPDTENMTIEVGTRLSNTDNSSGMNSDTFATVNVPVSETAAWRTVIGYVENQGFIDAKQLIALDNSNQPLLANPGDFANSPPVELSKKDTNGNSIEHIRSSFLWNVNDSLSALLSYHYQKDEADGRQVEGNDSDDYEHINRALEPLERDLEIFALEIEADLGFATFSSSSSSYENEAEMITDASGPYLNSDFWYSYYYDGSPRELAIGENSSDDQAFVQEIRLASNGDNSNIDWVAGVFYRDQEVDTVNTEYAPGLYDYQGFVSPAPKDQTYHQVDNTTFKDKAIFGELTYHFTEALQVTLGARFFKQNFEVSRLISLPYCGSFCSDDFTNPLGLSTAERKLEFEDEIFKVNTSYNFTEDLMLFATWAEGFRRGGANGVPTSDTSPNAPFAEDPVLAGYDSDNATNWEIGFKGSAWDQRMQFTAAAFYIEWEDIQIEAIGPISATNVAVNGDSARSKGIELELTAALTENLIATFGYGYADAELTGDFNVGGVIGHRGDRLPNSPENTANISFDYRHNVTEAVEMIFHVGGNYMDAVQTDLNPSNGNFSEVDSYDLWDTSLSLEADNWSVSLFVDNATNEKAKANTRGAGAYTSSLNPESGRDIFSYVARPRTAGVSINYKYL